MGTQYNQLTEYERCTIYRLYTDGLSRAEIGRRIDRRPSTVSRELKRNALKNGYFPVSAERMGMRFIGHQAVAPLPAQRSNF